MPKASTKTDAEKAADLQAKADKFKELGTKRLNAALDAISKLDALGNRNSYVYTDAQVEVIKNALQAQCIKTLSRFQPGAAAVAPAVQL